MPTKSNSKRKKQKITKADKIALKQYAKSLYPDVELQQSVEEEPDEYVEDKSKHHGSLQKLRIIWFCAFLTVLLDFIAIGVVTSGVVIIAGLISIAIAGAVSYFQVKIENVECKMKQCISDYIESRFLTSHLLSTSFIALPIPSPSKSTARHTREDKDTKKTQWSFKGQK